MLGPYRILVAAACLLALVGTVTEAVVYCDYSDEKRNRITKPKKPKVKKPEVTETEVKVASKLAHEAVVETHKLEHELVRYLSLI